MSDQPVKTRAARPAPPRVARAMGRQIAALAKKSGAMDPALATHWPQIVGTDLASLCRPMRIIKRGRHQALEISVSSGAAAMRLQFAQADILQRAAHHLRLPTLKQLEIRQTGATAVKAKPGLPGTSRRRTGRWGSQKLTAADIPTPPPAPPEPPAQSVSEALARLKNSLEKPSK